MLFAAGGILAITKPGNLGDGDEVGAEATTSTTEAEQPDVTDDEGTSTTAGDPTTSTTAGEGSPTTVDPAGQPTDTTVPGGGSVGAGDPGEGTTTSTIGGSGIAGGGTPTGGVDGIADTGHESLLGAGLGLAALGLALRRLRASA